MGESEPVYVELVDALELYASIIGGTTGQAADQLRDQAGLENALGRPRNYAHYQEADLALQAAALAHGAAESWIIDLSAGTTPEELAELIRSRLQAVE